MSKHFNSGCVFGRVMEEPKKEKSKGGEEYITFKVSCSGAKSGSMTAYCRLWTPERIVPFLSTYRQNTNQQFFFKGFFSQYKTDKNEFMSNFTIFQWEQRDKVDPRAVFILRGLVDSALPMSNGDQRILFKLNRENQSEELFELFSPGEFLLEPVSADDFCEVKGYVRQQQTEDEFGGASGPIRAYIHELKVL